MSAPTVPGPEDNLLIEGREVSIAHIEAAAHALIHSPDAEPSVKGLANVLLALLEERHGGQESIEWGLAWAGGVLRYPTEARARRQRDLAHNGELVKRRVLVRPEAITPLGEWEEAS